jgi:hypothetical protein
VAFHFIADRATRRHKHKVWKLEYFVIKGTQFCCIEENGVEAEVSAPSERLNLMAQQQLS